MTLIRMARFHEEPRADAVAGGLCEVLDGQPGDLLTWRK